MSEIPDVQIVGQVIKYGLEMERGRSSVLTAYVRQADGTIGRTFLRFSPEATEALQHKAAGLRPPQV